MHEVSLVADLIEVAKAQANGKRITEIQVRHATTIPDPMLRQAYEMVTDKTELQGVTLTAEPFDVHLDCKTCDFDGILHHHDIEGHVTICPSCGNLEDLEAPAEIELMSIRCE